MSVVAPLYKTGMKVFIVRWDNQTLPVIHTGKIVRVEGARQKSLNGPLEIGYFVKSTTTEGVCYECGESEIFRERIHAVAQALTSINKRIRNLAERATDLVNKEIAE